MLRTVNEDGYNGSLTLLCLVSIRVHWTCRGNEGIKICFKVQLTSKNVHGIIEITLYEVFLWIIQLPIIFYYIAFHIVPSNYATD